MILFHLSVVVLKIGSEVKKKGSERIKSDI